MKIEIEKSEYDRLKSREEKLMAYYEWFVDKENDLATVEDIVNENIELRNTLEDVYKAKRELWMEKGKLLALSEHKTEMVMRLWKIKDELEEENKNLNIKVASLEWEIKWLNSVIDKLKEENQTLELWLDNKEKVNKSLREELEKRRFSLDEYDYIILTSTTPQIEIIKK